MKRTLSLSVPALALLALACNTDPDFNVSGTWALTESISSQTGITCQAAGELLVSQSSNGSRFTGQRSRTGTCTGAPAGFTVDGATGIIGGEVQGSTLIMEIDFCDYEGTIQTEGSMSGTFTCPDGISQQQVVFTGTWQATRS